MILTAVNKSERLLYMAFIGNVTAAEVRNETDNVRALLADLPAGFRLLSDLERLGSMDVDCAEGIGETMDILKANGLERVIRVIPDTKKDIGLNILSAFHYGRKLRTVTCETIAEALRLIR